MNAVAQLSAAVRPEPSALPPLRDGIARVLAALDVPSELAQRVQLGVEEACAAAIFGRKGPHSPVWRVAGRRTADGDLTIDLQIRPARVQVEVRAAGEPLEESRFWRRTLDLASLVVEPPAGLRTYLMLRVADRAVLSHHGHENRFRMVFARGV